ncbi:MAG: substrate-binding domain-containing protein [Rhodobacteraceae bacterium]|nr:substrate-binding domain-containing protein [Paracoccaceae bacterium]
MRPWHSYPCAVACALVFLLLVTEASAQPGRVLVQSTTSTQNSGLYNYLLPFFEADTGYRVAVVAVGTGQALRNARAGDADVLLVHARAEEEAFVAEGYGLIRHDLMYNDFVITGPRTDPLGIGALTGLAAVMARIAEGKYKWISRGDNSGTHSKELEIWESVGLRDKARPSDWYLEAGSGMGATLRLAVELGAYTLSDRATWTAFAAKQNHAIIWEADPALLNQYGIIAVNPERFPHVNAAGARAFVDWMLSPHGQDLIAGFRVSGQQLFFPNAPP